MRDDVEAIAEDGAQHALGDVLGGEVPADELHLAAALGGARVAESGRAAASLWRIRVVTPIGHRTETPMRWRRRSFCKVSDRPTTAYFVVL